MKSLLALMFASTIGLAAAQPSFLTGQALYDFCASAGNNAAHFTCLMYIEGFLDGYSAREAAICFPEGLTTGEVAAAFVRVWRSIETWKGAANVGPVAQAPSGHAFTSIMMAAYPCKPSQ